MPSKSQPPAWSSLPVLLDADLNARLHDLLIAAARERGPAALRKLLDDGAVYTLVLTFQPGAPLAASLAQAVTPADPVAQWLDLSCI